VKKRINFFVQPSYQEKTKKTCSGTRNEGKLFYIIFGARLHIFW